MVVSADRRNQGRWKALPSANKCHHDDLTIGKGIWREWATGTKRKERRRKGEDVCIYLQDTTNIFLFNFLPLSPLPWTTSVLERKGVKETLPGRCSETLSLQRASVSMPTTPDGWQEHPCTSEGETTASQDTPGGIHNERKRDPKSVPSKKKHSKIIRSPFFPLLFPSQSCRSPNKGRGAPSSIPTTAILFCLLTPRLSGIFYASIHLP